MCRSSIKTIFAVFLFTFILNVCVFAQTQDGLVGWWKLDETSGAAGTAIVDSSGNGYHGTISQATPVAGIDAGAMYFDGVDDYISLPPEVFSSVVDGVTLSLWQYGGENIDNNERHYLLDASDSSGNTVFLQSVMPSGGGTVPKIQFSAGDYKNKEVDDISQIKGQWNNWTFTKDRVAGEMKMYINGQLFLSAAGQTSEMRNVAEVRLGMRSQDRSPYDGMLDDVRIYNRVLTEEEINGLAGYEYEGAYSFSPANGSETESIVMLEWECSLDGVSYDVYISDDEAEVSGRYADALISEGQAEKEYLAFHLYPERTYYWTVDVNDAGNIIISNTIVHFTTGPGEFATDPYPEDGQNFISPSKLSWTRAQVMINQDIYFGTDYDLVDNRNPDVLIASNTLTSEYELGELENRVTYYWLVDTNTPTGVLFSQGVWSFKAGERSGLDGHPNIFNLRRITEDWLTNNRKSKLLAKWDFDSGNTDDSSGNGYNGILNGDAHIEDDAVRGKVLSLDGNGDYVAFPEETLSGITDEITVAFWNYNEESDGSKASVFEGLTDFSGDPSSKRLRIYLPVNGTDIQVSVGARDSLQVDQVPSSVVGQWRHFAVSKSVDEGIIRVYMNGVEVGSSRGNDNPITGIKEVAMGSSATSNAEFFYKGKLDDFRVYRSVLSADNIVRVYNGLEPDFGGNDFVCTDKPSGDLNGDCRVNYLDYAILADKWFDVLATPTDVQSDNSSPRLGRVKGISWTKDFLDTEPYKGYNARLNACKSLTSKYLKWSHGKVQLVDWNGQGDHFGCLTDEENEIPYNEGQKDAWPYLEKKFNVPSDCLRWQVRAHNPSAGGSSFGATLGGATFLHECGHVMHLGHGNVHRYDDRDDHLNRIWLSNDDYGDCTTLMGRNGGESYNLPQLHRLCWIEPEKIAVFTKADSGMVYRIHNIYDFSEETLNDPSKVAGVVYYLPISGNRLWISINRRSVYGNDYYGDQLAMTKYVTDYHMTSGMKGSCAVDHKTADHTDCYGLTYEMVGKSDNAGDKGWVDIKITYNAADERRLLPLEITKRVVTVKQSPGPGKRGIVEVYLEIFNPNPEKGVDPFLTTRSHLTVPNTNNVKLIYGTRAWETKDPPVKRGQLHPIFPSQCTAQLLYEVTSKVGPLEPDDAHVTGSWKAAHMLPFEFPITFE